MSFVVVVVEATEGGTGEQDVPVSAVEAAAEDFSRLHGPHLSTPCDGFCALQCLAVERQQGLWTGIPWLLMAGLGCVAVAQIDGGVSTRFAGDILTVVG